MGMVFFWIPYGESFLENQRTERAIGTEYLVKLVRCYTLHHCQLETI